MRVLLDTNIVLDLLLRRQPWYGSDPRFWRAIRERRTIGYVTASMVTDIFYIARRLVGLDGAHYAVRQCLVTFVVLPVDQTILERALALSGRVFEDNVQLVCATAASLDAVITRDPDGYRDAPMPVLSPSEAMLRLR